MFMSRTGSEIDGGFLPTERDTFAEASFPPYQTANAANLRALWRRIHASRIQMVMINQTTYLGLVPGRHTTSLLKIGDTLFIFAPSNNPILSVTEFLSEILRNIPDESLRILQNLTEKQLRDALGGPGNAAVEPTEN